MLYRSIYPLTFSLVSIQGRTQIHKQVQPVLHSSYHPEIQPWQVYFSKAREDILAAPSSFEEEVATSHAAGYKMAMSAKLFSAATSGVYFSCFLP